MMIVMVTLPQAKRSTTKRRTISASILTSAPVKNKLTHKQQLKEEKEKRKIKRAEKKLAKQLRFEESKDINCPACDEPYIDPPVTVFSM